MATATSRTGVIERVDLPAMPRSVVSLIEFLDRHTRNGDEFPLFKVPAALRSPDVLSMAKTHWLVRIVAYRGHAIGSTAGLIGMSFSWVHYGDAGFPTDLAEALEHDARITDPRQRLHIGLRRQAIEACAERRLREGDKPLPDDLITLSVAHQRCHITPKQLREAIHDGRLKNYRLPGKAKNSPMRVSAREVELLWPKRA